MRKQNQDAPSVKVLITGISGVGKSTLFEKIVRRSKSKWVFLYDHKQGDLARRFGVKACFDAEQLIERIASLDSVGGGVVVYNPGKEYPGKPALGFEWFCQWLWMAKDEFEGKIVFGSDELDALVGVRKEPENFCVMLDQGRTFEIEIVVIAHATNGIHNQVRSQFTEIFCMMQGDKNGVDFLLERGFDPVKIAGLKHGLWLYNDKNTGRWAEGGSAFVPKNSGRNLKGL